LKPLNKHPNTKEVLLGTRSQVPKSSVGVAWPCRPGRSTSRCSICSASSGRSSPLPCE
jgi:hypothetical protein